MTVDMQFTISSIARATKDRGTNSAFMRAYVFGVVDVRWSPDIAPIKSKMVYASSKESIKRSFNGIGVEIQGTDYAEVSYEAVLDKVSKGRA